MSLNKKKIKKVLKKISRKISSLSKSREPKKTVDNLFPSKQQNFEKP